MFYIYFISLICYVFLCYFREDIPPLLLKEVNVSSNDELNVSVEDHRFEEYVPTKPKKKIFGGSGNVLGRYVFYILMCYVGKIFISLSFFFLSTYTF